VQKLITFFILAFLLSWCIWLPQYAHVFGAHISIRLPFNHAIGGLGPMLAAFIVTAIYDKEKLGDLFAGMFRVGNIVMLLVALCAPFLLALLAIFIDGLLTGHYESPAVLLRSGEFPEWSFLTFALYNIIFFGFGEEVGWRGLALPELQKRFRPLMASVILTVFWAVWHWPLFLYRPGYVAMGLPGIAGWVFSLLTGSMILTWLFNNSRQSILVCAIFHATIDIAFLAGHTNNNISGYMGFLITVWGVIIAYRLNKKAIT
jgi:CAAX amino terminal protease family.